jgi:hypothetical protein
MLFVLGAAAFATGIVCLLLGARDLALELFGAVAAAWTGAAAFPCGATGRVP